MQDNVPKFMGKSKASLSALMSGLSLRKNSGGYGGFHPPTPKHPTRPEIKTHNQPTSVFNKPDKVWQRPSLDSPCRAHESCNFFDSDLYAL